jgi:hypothetical protein
VSVDVTASLAVVLAAGSPSPSPAPNIDPARVTPGLLGLASLLFLVIAGFFLARSMMKQFKKINFDEDATELGIARPAAAPETAGAEDTTAIDVAEELPNGAQP